MQDLLTPKVLYAMIKAIFPGILLLLTLVVEYLVWQWLKSYLDLVIISGILIWAYAIFLQKAAEQGFEVDENIRTQYTFQIDKIKSKTNDNGELYNRLIDILDRLQSRIDKEYEDIHARTGWLLAAQGILLNAFVQVLNAERLENTTRDLLSVGVAGGGVVISFVLSLAVSYGHVLIETLKKARGQAEAETWKYGVPRTGVQVGAGAHKFGHFASRILPSAALVSWIVLSILAFSGDGLPRREPTATYITVANVNNPTGWIALPPSPGFEVGSAKFEDKAKKCPESGNTSEKSADEWIAEDIIPPWRQRPRPSAGDSIIVIGVADRLPLSASLRRQYGSNMGLARARAETVKNLLIDKTQKESAEHKLTANRITVQVLGPGFTPSQSKENLNVPAVNSLCSDDRYRIEDRRVQVWIPAP